MKKFLLLLLCAGCGAVLAAEDDITFHGTLMSPPACSISGGQTIEVQFRDLIIDSTDGLKLTRRILGNAADYLADDGVLICEVGNSMVHLMEQYPDVPFTWLEFDNGGDGVFMLTKEQLIAAREHFAIYKD